LAFFSVFSILQQLRAYSKNCGGVAVLEPIHQHIGSAAANQLDQQLPAATFCLIGIRQAKTATAIRLPLFQAAHFAIILSSCAPRNERRARSGKSDFGMQNRHETPAFKMPDNEQQSEEHGCISIQSYIVSIDSGILILILDAG